MARFIIAYRGGAKRPTTKEEQEQYMKNWQSWMSGLGDAILNPPGTPLGKSKLVSSNGTEQAGENALEGYLLVKAEDMNAALEIAKSDPYIALGGTIEVAEIMEKQ